MWGDMFEKQRKLGQAWVGRATQPSQVWGLLVIMTGLDGELQGLPPNRCGTTCGLVSSMGNHGRCQGCWEPAFIYRANPHYLCE